MLPFLKKNINSHLTALCLGQALIHQGHHLLIVEKPLLFRCTYAHLQDVTAEGPCFCIVPCRSATLSFWSRCRTSIVCPLLGRARRLQFGFLFVLAHHPPGKKKTARARIREPKLPPQKKPRTGLLHCKKQKEKKRKGKWSCIRARIRALMHRIDDKNVSLHVEFARF